ncbi:MAG: hypothetical protein M3O46_04645 [Myxococcota bacterium]|nr:hypothetical protein [Myxococcota bacterium]
MPNEPTKSANDEATLAVPGILCVSPTSSGQSVVFLGSAAGWMVPTGILRWERELSFMARTAMTAELAKELHATLPLEQIAPKRFAMAKRAVEASPFLPLSSNLVDDVRKAGVRVHTVGVDRVSSGFYYFAEGGSREALRVQGNLVEMLSPSVNASSSNADINALLEGLIDRLLSSLSDGILSELAVELANALPRLTKDGTGLVDTDLEDFDARARDLADRSARFDAAARELALAIASAERAGESRVPVALYGEARREPSVALDVLVMGKPLQLPPRSRWLVTGAPRDTVRAPAAYSPRPVAPAMPALNVERTARVAEPPSKSAPVTTAASPSTATAVPAATVAVATKQEASATRQEASATKQEASAAPNPEPSATPAAVSAQERDRRPASSRRASLTPIFLLLAFAASVYFLWHDLQ